MTRVCIDQPALPQYRIPVFRSLAMRSDIDLAVYYATDPNLANVQADGFIAHPTRHSQLRIAGQTLFWSSVQLRLATRKHADVLILPWNARYLSLRPALMRARHNRVGTILWGHGYSKNESPRRAALRYRLAARADALLFYNNTAADQAKARGVPGEKIFVALNALDQQPIQSARQHWLDRPSELIAFQQAQNLYERPTVLFVSRLERDNRVDLLLQAAHKLKEIIPSIRVVIVGKGVQRSELEQRAAELGLAETVTFTGPIYDEIQLAPYFLSASVFCYPENIGLSILHAMGYGLPVVTSDKTESQNPEIEAIKHSHNGLVYSHGSLASLVDALERLLTNTTLQATLASNARTTATQCFSLVNMVDGFEKAIRYAQSIHAR